MPPTTFYLRLQNGIAGGFAPPQPSAIHTVIRDESSASLLVTSSTDPSAATAAPVAKPLSLDSNTQDLLDELHAILKQLPTEQPPGSQDIYGLDIGIAWGSDDLKWANGGPDGCGGGFSEVQATDDQRAKFKRAVEIVDTLVGKV